MAETHPGEPEKLAALPTSPLGRPMIDPETEAERLRELERLGISLDLPDQSLQEVVERVAQVYGVSLCTVNLILEERQVFKAWAPRTRRW